MNLSELEQEVLLEFINMGVGRAAASMAEIVGSEVELSVPRIEFLNWDDLPSTFREQSIDSLVGVGQHFEGPFSGDAMLVFPGQDSLNLVSSMIGEEAVSEDFTELEKEALLEVGNILLNACLGTLSNVLGKEINCSLPSFSEGKPVDVFWQENGEGSGILFVHIDFIVSTHSIKGYIVFLLDVPSVKSFKEHIQEYIETLT